MGVRASLGVLFIFIHAECSNGNTHTFTANTNFDNANKWMNAEHGVPCAGDKVEFPSAKVISVFVQTNFTVTEVYLPIDGEFIFGDGVVWGSSEELSSCEDSHSGHVVTYVSDPDDWYETTNWQAADSNDQMFGPQDLLDIEHVPCDNDRANFPAQNSFTVSIYQDVNLQSLTVWNQDMTTESFANYRKNEGKYQFPVNDGSVKIDPKACTDPTGCVCHQQATDLQSVFASICEGKCQDDPSCLKPVKAVGQCCQACGAVLKMNYTDSYTEQSMRLYLKNFTTNPKYTGAHTALSKISQDMVAAQTAYQQKQQGRNYARAGFRQETGTYIQILITDEEVDAKSGDVAKALAKDISADLTAHGEDHGISSVDMQSSGAGQNPSSDTNAGVIVGIVIGTLIGITLLTGIVVLFMRRHPSHGSKYNLPFNLDKSEKTFENPMYPVAAITEVGPGREHESTDDHPNVPKPVAEVTNVGIPQRSAMDSDFGVAFGNPVYEDEFM